MNSLGKETGYPIKDRFTCEVDKKNYINEYSIFFLDRSKLKDWKDKIMSPIPD
jgi:hypothetical protein